MRINNLHDKRLDEDCFSLLVEPKVRIPAVSLSRQKISFIMKETEESHEVFEKFRDNART